MPDVIDGVHVSGTDFRIDQPCRFHYKPSPAYARIARQGTRDSAINKWGHVVEETSDPQGVYAINPDAMEDGIKRWLTPVVDELKRISGGYTQAHAEVKAAHDSETPGWFGGEGNVEVRWATSSFLNAAEWQLRQLVDDAGQLAGSLEEYRNMLLQHINGARAMDNRNAERFRAISRELDEMGWR